MKSFFLYQLKKLSLLTYNEKKQILDIDDNFFIFDQIWYKLSDSILKEILKQTPIHLLSKNAINNLKADLRNRLAQLCSIPIWEYYLSESLCISPTSLLCYSVKNDFLYKNFKSRLLNGELIVFFKNHKVLLSKVNILISNFKNSLIKFLQRYNNDLHELKKIFTITKTTTINEIKFKSDLHNGGESVLFIEIESDHKIRLIYKPKNIFTEHIFRQFLKELKKYGLLSVVREVLYLLRKDYGWVEYITHNEIKEKEELIHYYTRAGTVLCLAYILKITDLHSENIIAQDGHPQIVDMEAMFHPHLLNIKNNFSVLQTGLIPNNKLEYYNLFGFTASEPIQSGGYHCIWTNLGKDDVHPKFMNGYYPLQNNIPVFNSKMIMIYNYIEALCFGFKTTYDLILKEKKVFTTLLENLTKNLDIESRIIMRSTMYYSTILKNSNLYYYNNSNANKNYIMSMLLKNIPSNLPCKKEELIKAELSALERQDIPCFRYNLRNKNILEHTNIVCTAPSIDPIKSTILMMNKLCNRDKKKQLKLIKTNLKEQQEKYSINFNS
jgi:type 2 lantibiotic biosynthesis protein LanM